MELKRNHGENNPFYGKRHSEETRKKMSELKKGKPHSDEHRRKNSEGHKGEKSYMFGKPKSPEIRKKLSEANKGKRLSIETRRKMSEAQKGEKGSNWQGGKSFEVYPQDWTYDLKESIRKRDNYTCQECGIHKDELNRKLHVHHIDYNKKNCNPINFITLCCACHMKTNYNKEYWMEYFKNE